MSLEQARVGYMELETESATTDMKIITLKSRLTETSNVVVTQKCELDYLRATVHYLENRVRSLSLIFLSFQERLATTNDSSYNLLREHPHSPTLYSLNRMLFSIVLSAL